MHVFSRRSAGYLVVATGLALTLTGPLSAQSQGQEVTGRDQKQLVESLRSGGYVIVVRHGATFSDQADTDPFNFDNLAKQRNLNEKGKELAKAFGDANPSSWHPCRRSLYEQFQSCVRDGGTRRI
jgi:hypothetical protein